MISKKEFVMSRNDELPYFHISPISGLGQTYDDCGYILCTTDNVVYEGPNILVLRFMDVEYEKHPDRFKREDAKTIRLFVEKMLEEGVREFFVACDYGQSRSPAIAACLAETYGSGADYIWNNKEDYDPNMLVYRILKEELNK